MSARQVSETFPLTEVATDDEKQVWRIVRKLGSGSFGAVYQGVNTNEDAEPREVAIKLEDASHPQLAYEAKLLRELRSGNPKIQVCPRYNNRII